MPVTVSEVTLYICWHSRPLGGAAEPRVLVLWNI